MCPVMRQWTDFLPCNLVCHPHMRAHITVVLLYYTLFYRRCLLNYPIVPARPFPHALCLMPTHLLMPLVIILWLLCHYPYPIYYFFIVLPLCVTRAYVHYCQVHTDTLYLVGRRFVTCHSHFVIHPFPPFFLYCIPLFVTLIPTLYLPTFYYYFLTGLLCAVPFLCTFPY